MVSDKNKFIYNFVTNVAFYKRVNIVKIIFFLLFLVKCFVTDFFRLFQKASFKFQRDFKKYIIILESFNNLRALEFLFNKLDIDSISILSKSQRTIANSNYKNFSNEIFWNDGIKLNWLLNKYLYLINILFSSKFSNHFFRSIENDFYFICMLNELLARIDLKNNVIITSNDINVFSRSILFHCNKNSICNVYIQHASVSSLFPELTNTMAILYGEYTKKEYSIDKNVKLELVGNHLFDSHKDLIFKKELSITQLKNKSIVVGIGYNLIDDLGKVSKLIDKIYNDLPFVKIIIRAHPRDSRSFSSSSLFQVDTNEDVTDFFKEIDVLISGISGIILEAALINIYPIIFDFRINKSFDIDYYSYVKNNVAILLDENEIVSLIANIHKGTVILKPTRNNCSYYDASIGSNWEFKTTSKILKLIKSI